MKLRVIHYSSNDELPERVRESLPDTVFLSAFRESLNKAFAEGANEVYAYLKAYRTLEALGLERRDGKWVTKQSPTVESVHSKSPMGVLNLDGTLQLDTNKFEEVGLEISTSTVTRYLPPKEVKEAASKALQNNPQELTQPLSEAGLELSQVKKLAEFFEFNPADSIGEELLQAWGGKLAPKWAARILRKKDNNSEPSSVELTGTIVQKDDSQQLVFGWFSVVQIDGRDVTDVQGDIITPETIENSAYGFVLESRTAGEMHEQIKGEVRGVGRLVESVVFTRDKQRAMIESLQAQGIPALMDLHCICWWGGFYIEDPETWAKVTAGQLRAWSIGGSGTRKQVAA